MNFLYVKKENTALNQTDISLDLRKFSSVRDAVKFCNRVNSFTGVYANVTENSFYAYAPFSDTEINSLYIPNTAGHYVLIKDLKFYSDRLDTTIVSSQEEINTLLTSGDVVKYPSNSIKSTTKLNLHVLSAAQEEANCIFILYKCENEKDRLSMNWSSAVLDTIIYTMSPIVDIETFVEQKLIKEGKYIVRQIYFVDVEEADYEFLSLLRLCNVITYVDNIAVKKSWIPDMETNTFVYHKFNISLKKGVHSIMNDFSFDTEQLTHVSTEGEVFKLNTAQVFRKKGVVDYSTINEVLFKKNPLLATTFVNEENSYFIQNCTGANKSNMTTRPECKEIISKDYFSEEARLEFKKIFIDHTVNENHMDYLAYHSGLEVSEDIIRFLYTDTTANTTADFDALSFAKERVESYFVRMFHNMESVSDKDLMHIRFLLPILSKYGEVSKQFSKDMLYINFLEDCYSNKGMDKDLCREVETSLRNSGDKETIDKITAVVDNSDYLFCTTYDLESHTYGFEVDKLRCEKTVLSNTELTNYLLSSKCTDDSGRWKGGEYCINRSVNPWNIENKQRKLYYQQIFTSKDRLNNLVEGGEVESLAEFINYAGNEFLVEEGKYDNIDFLVSEPIIELCSGVEGADKYYDLCDGIHSSIKYIQPSVDITGGVEADSSKLSEAQRLIALIEKNRNLVTTGRKCLEGTDISPECKYIFDTEDSTNLVLYSGEIFKFCKKNPFNSDCVKYYENIDKYTKKVESFENKEGSKWYYFFILIIVIAVITAVYLFSRKDSLSAFWSVKEKQPQLPLSSI